MDSLNLFKGYGQLEDQSLHKPSPAKKHRLIAISAAILLVLVGAGAIAVGTLTRNSTPKSLSAASADSAIRLFCSVTRRPDSCIAAMEASVPPPSPDPESILRLALRKSHGEIANFSSSLESFGDSDDAALRDCRDLMDDAQSRVADSEAGAEDLTDLKLMDLSTWLSAAVTDHDTCLDGLEEVGSKAFEVVRANMEKSKEFTSNALAMVANFHDILDKFDKLKH